jgi:regulator of sigma E protease
MSFLGNGSFFVFVVVLGVLVFVHELGHFLTARWLKVHIEEFGFGFPPRLLGVVRDANGRLRLFLGRNAPKPAELGGARTIYSLNAIPLGGFVRPAGEDDPTVPGGLASAPKLHRLVILSAGAAFNLLFAFLIFVVGFRLGWPDRVYIAGVGEGSPAEAVGLRVGDVVLRANGVDIHYPQQLIEVTYDNLGQPVTLRVEREGQALELTLTPRPQPPEGQGPMGIQMGQALVTDYTWPQAVGRAGQELYFHFNELLRLPGRIIRQEIPLAVARPIGLVGLSDLTNVAVETAQEIDEWFPILQLVGLISVALATTNLLPLPALDGGRIVFVLIEVVRGRRVDPAREGLVHLVGFAMLLALMVVITYHDIVNPIVPR